MAVSEELNLEQRQELKSLLAEFDQVFNDLPGEAKVTPFRVETGDSKPISQYPRRLPEKWKTKIHDQIKTLQASGIITPSTSPWASPIVPVPKPNGDVRMCIDYRQLNAVTQSDVYPLPRVDQLLEDVSRAQYIGSRVLPVPCGRGAPVLDCFCHTHGEVGIQQDALWAQGGSCCFPAGNGLPVPGQDRIVCFY